MNTVKDLFSVEELKKYQLTLYPFNISLLRSKLDEKLKEDPDYEVFVPLVYYRHSSYVKDNQVELKVYNAFISNKGTVLSKRTGEPEVLAPHISGEYPTVRFTLNKRPCYLKVHRALACAFVPVPDDFKSEHPKDLQVNHMDGIKVNLELSNLEWTTNSGNITHAYANGLITRVSGLDKSCTIPVKGRVIEGKYKGYEFILAGETEVVKHGFQQGRISDCVNGKRKTHFSCAFTVATEAELETLPRGITDRIRNELEYLGTPDILAVHKETGLEKIIKGGKPKLLELGFMPQHVYSVINGKRPHHRGYSFSRILEKGFL